WFPAWAIILLDMIAEFDVINRQFKAYSLVHTLNHLALLFSASHIRLICDDDKSKARTPQSINRLGHSGQKFQLFQRRRRKGSPLSHNRTVNDTVAIQKDRTIHSGMETSEPAMLSHFI